MLYTSTFMRPANEYSRETDSHSVIQARLEDVKPEVKKSPKFSHWNSQIALQTECPVNAHSPSKHRIAHHRHKRQRHHTTHELPSQGHTECHLLPLPSGYNNKVRPTEFIPKYPSVPSCPGYLSPFDVTADSSSASSRQLVPVDVHDVQPTGEDSMLMLRSFEGGLMPKPASFDDVIRQGISAECALSCPSLESDAVSRDGGQIVSKVRRNNKTEVSDGFSTTAKEAGISYSRVSDGLAPVKDASNANTTTFSDRLLYFPSMSNKLHVQFKETESSTNRFVKNQPLIGSFLPLIGASRTKDRYGKPIPVIVERKRNKQLLGIEGSPLKRTTLLRRRLDSLWPLRDSRHAQPIQNHRGDFQDNGSPTSTPSRSGTYGLLGLHSQSSTGSLDDSSTRECHRIVLNVSGLKFEINTRLLDRHPTTLLGNRDKRKCFYDVARKEYFFDRHRPSFEAIFSYYHTGGSLKRPISVSDDVFVKELEFFQVEQEALDLYRKNEGYVPETIILPANKWKRKLWLLCEYPDTSPLAFCLSVTSVLFTVISIILFCVETLPRYAMTHCEAGDAPNFLDPFFIIESMCTLWFTIELIIRFSSCPNHKTFVKDLKNWIDLSAIIPYYITLTNVLISFSCDGAKGSASLAFLRVIRLIRVFKLTKHSSGLQVLVLTFKESIEGLGLFLVAFIVCILVFSSTIYYIEIDHKGSQIESIPDAFWWAVITMCTVGYGDKVPKSPLGKVVGSICAVAGVLTLAIPVPIITENFNKFYAYKTGRGRR